MNDNRLTDGWTDGRTDGRTDRREDQQTSTTNYNHRLAIYVTVNLTTCSIRQVSIPTKGPTLCVWHMPQHIFSHTQYFLSHT